MSIGRIVRSALIAVAAAIMVYTIVGAVSIVWGVSQLSEMPITVKLFLPVIFGYARRNAWRDGRSENAQP